jgi:uncharacterized protein with PIN domain
MGVPCRRCGRAYDVALFQFGRTLHCTCGARVALEPRLRSTSSRAGVRFSADAMLGRLARWLRIAGYDTRCDAHIPDSELVRTALDEQRIILTRDRALAREWSVEDVLVLEAEDALEQLREVAVRYPLDWRARAFSRCSRCNTPVEPVGLHEVRERVPAGVIARRPALARCPRCGRIYWEGSHTDRMRRVLGRALDPGAAA